MKIEEADSYKTLVHIYQTTQHHIPEDCDLYIQCRGNLKSHEVSLHASGILAARKSLYMVKHKARVCKRHKNHNYDVLKKQ